MRTCRTVLGIRADLSAGAVGWCWTCMSTEDRFLMDQTDPENRLAVLLGRLGEFGPLKHELLQALHGGAQRVTSRAA